MKKESILGVLCAVGSAVIYGLCAVIVKQISTAEISAETIIFGRGLIGALLALCLGAVRKEKIRIRRENVPKIAALGLVGMCGTLFLLNRSYLLIPVGVTTSIHFIYPMVVSISLALIWKKRVPLLTWVTMLLCFLGMLIITGRQSGLAPRGIVLAVCSSFTWSFYMLYMEKSGVLQENKTSIVFGIAVSMAIFGAVTGGLSHSLNIRSFLPALPMIAIIALSNNILADLMVQYGIKTIGAQKVAIFSVLEPVTSAVFGAVLLRESLKQRQLVGICVILIPVIVFLCCSSAAEKRQEQKN